MSTLPKSTKATVIPCLRYHDAPTAIEWLCANLGFEKQMVVPGEGGAIVHAQLSFGNGMIMIGSVAETEYGKLCCQPDQVGGSETQSPYLVVTDADEIYRRVKSSGGRIAIDIKDEDYGGRGFSFHDPEGHLWNVGTYDPWQGEES